MLANDFQTVTEPVHLFAHADVFGIRTGRIASYIDDGGCLVYNLMKTSGNVFLGFASASGIEGVGRYVQYAHHLRLGEVH